MDVAEAKTILRATSPQRAGGGAETTRIVSLRQGKRGAKKKPNPKPQQEDTE